MNFKAGKTFVQISLFTTAVINIFMKTVEDISHRNWLRPKSVSVFIGLTLSMWPKTRLQINVYVDIS